MRRGKKMVLMLWACLLAAGTAKSQATLPPETRNAALRYWQAFAELQDPPADPATQELLEKAAAGEAAWDEARLGPILDKNQWAILRMQRATKLPECDWGLEYRHDASIAYAPRARVLARLNTLYGMRLAAKGDTAGAVDAWLDGIRFSQHVAEGGSLIFALIAQSGLLSNVTALTRATQSGSLTSADRQRVGAAVRALPESGFDWSAAMQIEEAILYKEVDEMAQSANPAESYRAAMGEAAPQNFSVPSAGERAAYHRLMTDVEETLRLPPDAARTHLGALSRELSDGQVNGFFRRTTPSFVRVNEARAVIAGARDRLLQALAASR
jgi:hypothetical protein